MTLRIRLIRALDEEIPVSPREFTVETRQASIAIARWKREHPDQSVTEGVVFEAVREALVRNWGVPAVVPLEAALHRVAQRICNRAQPLEGPAALAPEARVKVARRFSAGAAKKDSRVP